MVGVGERTERSMLAQVCIVNYDAQVVYCTYVAPTAEISGASSIKRYNYGLLHQPLHTH